MTDQQWLDYYDQIAEIIDDEILDLMDDKYDISENNLSLPDQYFIDSAKMYANGYGLS
jgi:hypothetical protein